MTDLTQSMWNFLHGAYEQGVLKDLLVFMGERTDKDADLGEVLGNMEDFMAEADFSPMEEFSEEILPLLLDSLSQAKAMQGLKEFLTILREWLKTMEAAGMDPKVMVETFKSLGKSIVVLAPVFKSLTPVMAKRHGAMINSALEEQAGAQIAGVLNAGFLAVNQNPKLVKHILRDIIRNLDAQEMSRAFKLIGGILWDQRPPVTRKPAAALVEGAKKQLLKMRRK